MFEMLLWGVTEKVGADDCNLSNLCVGEHAKLLITVGV